MNWFDDRNAVALLVEHLASRCWHGSPTLGERIADVVRRPWDYEADYRAAASIARHLERHPDHVVAEAEDTPEGVLVWQCGGRPNDWNPRIPACPEPPSFTAAGSSCLWRYEQTATKEKAA